MRARINAGARILTMERQLGDTVAKGMRLEDPRTQLHTHLTRISTLEKASGADVGLCASGGFLAPFCAPARAVRPHEVPPQPVQARRVQHDAVKARCANVLFFGFSQIVPIGLNNVTGCGTQFIGGVLQAGVFFFRVSQWSEFNPTYKISPSLLASLRYSI